jgi:hypothetical protein
VLRLRDTELSDLCAADVYSFGMTIYAIIRRETPHAHLNAMQMGMKVRDHVGDVCMCVFMCCMSAWVPLFRLC